LRLEEVISWDRFTVLGHRGAPLSKTENTLESFVAAISCGADGVELDVHLSSDKVPVVCHDPDVVAVSGERIAVRNAPWSELSDTDVVMGGKRGRLCRLEEVLDATGDHLVDIELKDLPLGAPEMASSPVGEIVASVVRDRGGIGRVLLSSFYLPHLQQAQKIAPEIPRGWLLPPSVKPSDVAEMASAEGMSYLLPHTSAIPQSGHELESLVDAAHEKGLSLIYWTVNDPEVSQRLAAAGAAGVITDDPESTIEALRGRRTSSST
jgi:glycerophosphoryl diester phosphodiesterase